MNKNEGSQTTLKPSKHGDGSLICSFNGALRKFPHSMVRLVEPIGPIAPVPFSLSPFEGLINSQNGLSPIFDFSHHLGGKAQSGKYCLLIQAKKGLIRLRVDEIISLDSSTYPNEANIPCAIDEIDAMLKDFRDSSKNVCSTIESLKIAPVESISLLIIQAGSQIFAFDIHGVSFIEHHKKNKPLNPKDTLHRIVTLQDESLVSGISLSSWLEADGGNAEGDLWSIGYKNNELATVITVPQILGVEAVELPLIHKIQNNGESAIWINHPKYGAIKVLNIEYFSSTGSNQITKDTEALIDKSPTQPTLEKTLNTSNGSSGLGVRFDQFGLVLPIELVGSVNTKISNINARKKPFKHSLPAFDLNKIPGLAISQPDHGERRSITVRQPNQRNIVFLAPEIYEPSNGGVWEPTPTLPKSLSKMVSAVRVQDSYCELLLNPQVVSDSPSADIQKIANKAFCGWINHS
jgi:hypothetical protein